MVTKPDTGLLGYLDEQIEALRTHVPAALVGFDATGIHQSRVATRRLKAGLIVLAQLSADQAIYDLDRVGKKLRRRLGPLRDLDVMIEHLGAYPISERLKPAVEWVGKQMEADRVRSREKDQKRKPASKLLVSFEAWWNLRQIVEPVQQGIGSVLTHAAHEHFMHFRDEADVLSGLAANASDRHIDVHQLRIDGKALRYTLEMADAHGFRIPKKILKTFKIMQESLGEWHDRVVLSEQTLAQFTRHELPLHDPDLAMLTLDLAKQFLKDSTTHLNQFLSRWRRSGKSIAKMLDERVPIIRDVAAEVFSGSQTDPDRPETGATPPPATPVTSDPQVVTE